jgi:hypothetical protein
MTPPHSARAALTSAPLHDAREFTLDLVFAHLRDHARLGLDGSADPAPEKRDADGVLAGPTP